MGGKIRCTTCHHKLNGRFTGDNCQRRACPHKDDESFQVLTFKDWKSPSFDVIENLECKANDYSWPTAAGSGYYYDPVTQEWKEGTTCDYGGC